MARGGAAGPRLGGAGRATVAPGHAGSGPGRLGPALLVAVGYMDPGNWATDVEAGARFGLSLLWVLCAANLVALLVQYLAARLGIIAGLDLAQACRLGYPDHLRRPLWLLAETGIVACDLAEVLGCALALNLLFGLPLAWGAALTLLDALLLLGLRDPLHGARQPARLLERIALGLMVVIAGCLLLELGWALATPGSMTPHATPRLDGGSLLVAIGMLGATVMPHNLYLHSALVRAPEGACPVAERRPRLRAAALDLACALHPALLVNLAILVLAALVFASRGIVVDDLRAAHALLTPLLGTGAAALLFALGLWCAGQSSTITGTLAGQIVMEGFLDLRLRPVARRLLTRGLALVPALAILTWSGPTGVLPLLVVSQVVLSLQLPFALVPLVRLTGAGALMGDAPNPRALQWAGWAVTGLVVAVNAWLLAQTSGDWIVAAPDQMLARVTLVALAGLPLLWLFMAVCRAPLTTPRTALQTALADASPDPATNAAAAPASAAPVLTTSPAP